MTQAQRQAWRIAYALHDSFYDPLFRAQQEGDVEQIEALYEAIGDTLSRYSQGADGYTKELIKASYEALVASTKPNTV